MISWIPINRVCLGITVRLMRLHTLAMVLYKCCGLCPVTPHEAVYSGYEWSEAPRDEVFTAAQWSRSFPFLSLSLYLDRLVQRINLLHQLSCVYNKTLSMK